MDQTLISLAAMFVAGALAGWPLGRMYGRVEQATKDELRRAREAGEREPEPERMHLIYVAAADGVRILERERAC